MNPQKKFGIIKNALSVFSFLLLFLLAFLYFKERIYQDAAYYLMFVINDRGFHVEHDRWVLILSQFLPWLGVKLQLSLKTILILHSISTPVFALIVFLVLKLWLKDEAGVLSVIALQFLGILQGFFTPMFEMYYGLCLSVLLFSLLRSNRSWWHWLVIVPLEIVVLFSHPMVFLVVAFYSVWLLLERRRAFLTPFLIIWIVIVLSIIIKKFSFSEYESGKVGQFTAGFENGNYRNFIRADWLKSMVNFLFQQYYYGIILLLITMLIWLQKRKFGLVLLLPLFIYITICFVNFNIYGFGTSRYREIQFYALIPLFALPFCYEIISLKNIPLKSFLVTLLFFFVFMQAYFITREWKQIFHPRMETMKRLIEKGNRYGHQRLILDPQNADFRFPGINWFHDKRNVWQCLFMPKTTIGYDLDDWSIPIESMLLSSLDGKEKSITIIRTTDFPDSVAAASSSPNFLFRLNEIKPVNWLHPDYFSLSSPHYISLHTADLLPDSLPSFGNEISLTPDTNAIIRQRNYFLVPVTIENKNPVPIPSNNKFQLFLSYHLTHDGKDIPFPARTSLETDVERLYKQYIRVTIPDSLHGTFQLRPDMIVEFKAWLNVNAPAITIESE